MFMTTWSKIAVNQPINQLPSFSRFLVSPPILFLSDSPDPFINRIFTRLSLHPPPPSNPLISFADPISRMYYVSAIDIARLQEIAGYKHSKFVCFTAYFWKILARSACLGEKSCSIGAVVDGRSRMKHVHGQKFVENYFGNVLSVPFGNLQVETLIDMKVAEVAEEVCKWLSPATTEEHFLGLLDWVESHRPEPMTARIYIGPSKEEDRPVSCVVSSGRGFPEINFGWGKAAFGSYHCPWEGNTGYLMPIPQPDTGDWVISAHVAPTITTAMEEPTIFHRLTTEYFLGADKSV